jgi:hypothetical protein
MVMPKKAEIVGIKVRWTTQRETAPSELAKPSQPSSRHKACSVPPQRRPALLQEAPHGWVGLKADRPVISRLRRL